MRCNIAHLTEAFLLKSRISDSKHLVNYEDLGFEVSCDGERQPDIHSAGVALDWRVDKFLNSGKCYNFVELSIYLSLLQSQNRAVEVDILFTCKFGVETCT